jgi:hypothetical protein
MSTIITTMAKITMTSPVYGIKVQVHVTVSVSAIKKLMIAYCALLLYAPAAAY